MTVETTNEVIVDAEFRDLIPPLSAEERAGLEADILRDGILDALKVWRTAEGDVLLDGYNRRATAVKFGIAYKVEVVPGIASREDAKCWIINHQRHRRNLNEAQRAMLAGLLANMECGDNQHSKAVSPIAEITRNPSGGGKISSRGEVGEVAQICATSQPEAARLFNVSRRSVQHARTVREKGIPELVGVVTEGKVSVSAAAAVASLPEAEQRRIVAGGQEAIKEAVRKIRRKKTAEQSAGKTSLPATPKERVVEEAEPQPDLPVAPDVKIASLNGILSCAQCGGEADFVEDYDLRHGPIYGLMCQNVACSMQTPMRRAKDDVRAIWNRRHAGIET